MQSVLDEMTQFPLSPVEELETPQRILWRHRPRTEGGAPNLVLHCNSISASKSKCGYRGHDPTVYGVSNPSGERYTDLNYDHCESLTLANFSGPVPNTQLFRYREFNYFGTTCGSCTTTGSLTFVDDCLDVGFSGDHTSCEGSGIDYGGTNCHPFGCVTFPAPCPPYLYDCIRGYAGGTNGGHEFMYTEFTTEMLIEETENALPPYYINFDCDTETGEPPPMETGQDCICSSFRNLSEDESSYSIRRLEYKFTFSPVACVGMEVNWVERFTPEGGGSPTDTPMSWTATSGDETETDIFTVDEPTSDGTITIIDYSVDRSGCV